MMVAEEVAMPDIPYRAIILATTGLIFAIVPQSPDEASAKRPKVTVLCLPPGGTAPMPCGVARSNSLIELSLGGPAAPPNYLVFSEVDPIGPPRTVRTALPATASVGGALRVALPRQLCAYPDVGRWRVKLASSGPQDMSVGTVSVRC
jgi:hypothetical protein